jgi:hypothetical protein
MCEEWKNTYSKQVLVNATILWISYPAGNFVTSRVSQQEFQK